MAIPKPADPITNVAIWHGNVQVRNLILLDMAVSLAHYMKPIHATNLLNIAAQYRTRYGFNGSSYSDGSNYIPRGDFNSLDSIFHRYKDELQERLEPEEELPRFLVGIVELEQHDAYITELLESHKADLANSNFELISRGEEPKV